MQYNLDRVEFNHAPPARVLGRSNSRRLAGQPKTSPPPLSASAFRAGTSPCVRRPALKTHRPGGAGRSEVPALARAARRLAVAVAPLAAGPRVRQSDSGSPHRAACARARRSTLGLATLVGCPPSASSGALALASSASNPRPGASILAALPRCALGLRASLPASVHGRASRPRGGREGQPRDGAGSARPHTWQAASA